MDKIQLLEAWFKNNYKQLSKTNNKIMHIYNFDNPGWGIEISFNDLKIKINNFKEMHSYISDNDWFHCKFISNVLNISGDSNKLEYMFNFLNSLLYDNTIKRNYFEGISIISWLQEWYKDKCDGDWEHLFGVDIWLKDNLKWEVLIDLEGTYLEDTSFDEVVYDTNEIECFIENNKFKAYGELFKLNEILYVFKDLDESC